jgi:hypothetical protein
MISLKDDVKQSTTGKEYSTPKVKVYTTPKLTEFGDLRDVSKGTYAYSLEEGVYQEMNPPS